MEYKKIGELFSYVSRGRSPKYVDNSDIYIINQACIRWDGIDYTKVKYQDASNYREDTCLHDGDIVLTSTGTGTLGRCCVFHQPDQRVYVADSHVTVLRGAVGILPDILCLYLRTQRGQNKLYAECVNGSTNQIELSKEKLRLFVIPVPTMTTQRALVSQTTHINKIIELRKTELFELDTLVKARFVEMFGDPIVNPKNWKKMKLVDVCTKLTDGTHFSPESYPEGEYRYVTAKNIKIDGFDFSNITYVPKSVHDEIYARCNPEYGDVLYIKDGVTTGIAMVNTLHEPFTMLSSVALLKQNRTLIEGAYLCGVLNNQNMYDAIRKDMGGAAITRLTIVKLKNIQIPVPPIELQNQFAAFVEQTDKSKFHYHIALVTNKLCGRT